MRECRVKAKFLASSYHNTAFSSSEKIAFFDWRNRASFLPVDNIADY